MPDDAHEIPQGVQISVPPEVEVGVYANFAAVSSQTDHDFNLDFVQLTPSEPGGGAPKGTVVARVKVAQSFLAPLLQALASHQFRVESRGKQTGQDPDAPGGN